MAQKISLQEIVAVDNTPKAKALLAKYGYQRAKNMHHLLKQLYQFTSEHREEALNELVKLHPHRELILTMEEEQAPTAIKLLPEATPTINHGKGCICPVCVPQKKSSFDAEDYLDFTGKKPIDTLNEYLPLIAVSSLFVLALTVIARQA